MPYIKVDQENSNNVELHYEDHGSGMPVVLIHGWPLNARSWEKQERALLNAGYRVITYDRRGFGESSKPAFGYDYDTLAKDLSILLNGLDLKTATLVGFSMGGGEVARYLGIYGTERVHKAAFIAAITPFFIKTSDNPSGVGAEIFTGIQKGLIADRPAFLAEFMKKFFNVDVLNKKNISSEAVRFNWMNSIMASPIATIACVTSWKTDFRKNLASFEIPTLIIHGDADKVVPFGASGKHTHKLIKGSQLHIIKDAPHGLNWTHAEQVNQILLDFIASNSL